jgi:hypothetical protein
LLGFRRPTELSHRVKQHLIVIALQSDHSACYKGMTQRLTKMNKTRVHTSPFAKSKNATPGAGGTG